MSEALTMWSRARWFGRCRTCDRVVWPGQHVGRWGRQWQHSSCVLVQWDLGSILDDL